MAVVARDWTRPFVMDLESGQSLRSMAKPPELDGAFGRGVVVSGDGRRAALLLGLPKPACAPDDVSGYGVCGAFVVYDVATGAALTGPVETPDGPDPSPSRGMEPS